MAFSEYYVDPNGGNDTTGDGTIGTPWATVQHALDTITRNSTDGDRINVKAGTADVLSATLSLATYGGPTNTTNLIIQGYTSTAGDGGIGEISGAGTYGICSAFQYSVFAYMKLGNCGSADVLDFAGGSSAINCEIYSSSGFGVDCGQNSIVLGCWLHDLTGTQAIDNGINVRIGYNYIDCAVTTSVIDDGSPSVIFGNIIDLSGADTSVVGINATQIGMTVVGNTIFCSNANTSQGIYINSHGILALNNIVEGWSGTGGDGIEKSANYCSYVGANAVYNCTTPYTLDNTKQTIVFSPNDTLDSSAFVNASSGDFDINGTITGVTEDAYPVGAFSGNSSVDNKADKGAVQRGAGTSSGGVNMPRVRVGH